MKILSRQEEILLLIIWRLKDNAYGVTIGLEITKATGKEWAPGAIYDSLYRLENNGYVESRLCEPTHERGGRSKRIFTLTKRGMDALSEQKELQRKLWGDVPDTIFKKLYGSLS